MEELEQCSDCKNFTGNQQLSCEKCLQSQTKKEEEKVKQLENKINELQIQLGLVREQINKMENNAIERKNNDKIEFDVIAVVKEYRKKIQQLESDELKQKNELIKLKNQILREL